MEATAVLLLLLGFSFVSAQNTQQHCNVARVSHNCRAGSGPVILNICYPYFDVIDTENCMRRTPEDSHYTCIPCCEDPGTSIPHCGAIRSGDDSPRWTLDIESVPTLNPCGSEYSEQECIQEGMRAVGPQIGETLWNIPTWQECQARCRQTERCEWFNHIDVNNKCVLKKTAQEQRNVVRATGRTRRSYTTGSVMSSSLTSQNCHCPDSTRYAPRTTTAMPSWSESNRRTTTARSSWSRSNRRTTTESSSWGWGSWGRSDPCPVGRRQAQDVFGQGITYCCPSVEGTDGTPVCEY